MAENYLRTLKFPGLATPYVIPAPFTAVDSNNSGHINFESYPSEEGGGDAPTIQLDTTLKQSGMAADAKAVGDKFTSFGLSSANVSKFIVYASTTNLPAVTEGAVLIAYDA